MGTLFLDRKDLALAYEGDCLVLIEEGRRKGTVPLKLLERVVIRGQATLAANLLGALAEHNIGVLLLSGRQHRATAMLLGKPHNDVKRRLAQYRWFLDDAERRKLSRWVVLAKLRAARRFLSFALENRPDQRKALWSGIKTLDGLLQQLRSEDRGFSLESLRGIEGSGTAAHFAAYQSLFAPSLAFTNRNRRPPKDPVNACLSLGYTLLHFDAVRACHETGLEPYVGFYHEPAFARESLACDFIEALRPKVDAWVWRLFRERLLRGEDFSDDNGHCLLNKNGRKRFYAEYEIFARPLRRLLRRYGHALAKRLLGA
jgi:CRISPR-associated protein Cas1